VKAEVRLYEHLFLEPEPDVANLAAALNPASCQVVTALVEPTVRDARPLEPVQFERLGYFARDPGATGDRLVFNRTVGLRDTAGKALAGAVA
jgi:glutaminyl-tRNA synthetase